MERGKCSCIYLWNPLTAATARTAAWEADYLVTLDRRERGGTVPPPIPVQVPVPVANKKPLPAGVQAAASPAAGGGALAQYGAACGLLFQI